MRLYAETAPKMLGWVLEKAESWMVMQSQIDLMPDSGEKKRLQDKLEGDKVGHWAVNLTITPLMDGIKKRLSHSATSDSLNNMGSVTVTDKIMAMALDGLKAKLDKQVDQAGSRPESNFEASSAILQAATGKELNIYPPDSTNIMVVENKPRNLSAGRPKRTNIGKPRVVVTPVTHGVEFE